jgi:hypothetical protein
VALTAELFTGEGYGALGAFYDCLSSTHLSISPTSLRLNQSSVELFIRCPCTLSGSGCPCVRLMGAILSYSESFPRSDLIP